MLLGCDSVDTKVQPAGLAWQHCIRTQFLLLEVVLCIRGQGLQDRMKSTVACLRLVLAQRGCVMADWQRGTAPGRFAVLGRCVVKQWYDLYACAKSNVAWACLY